MITIKTVKPMEIPLGVWESEVRFGDKMTPARRDKLVALLNLAGFVLKGGTPITKEIVDNGGIYKIGA